MAEKWKRGGLAENTRKSIAGKRNNYFMALISVKWWGFKLHELMTGLHYPSSRFVSLPLITCFKNIFIAGSMETGRLVATILLELSFDSTIRERLATQELAGMLASTISENRPFSFSI